MARGNQKKKRKRHGGERIGEEAKVVGQVHQLTAQLQRLLSLVQDQWPALLANDSMQKVAGRREEREPMWKAWEQLSVEEQLSACRISDPAIIGLIRSVVAASREWSRRNNEVNAGLAEGMFLSVRPPGREEAQHASIFQGWEDLRMRSVAFVKPDNKLASAESNLLERLSVLDGAAVGSRSRLALDIDSLSNVKDLIEGAIGEDISSGCFACTEIRRGDEDDLNTLKQQPQRTKTYEKLPSTLFSGSIASAVAVGFIQSIQSKISQGKVKQAIGSSNDEICSATFSYLHKSLEEFLESDSIRSLALSEGEVNLLNECLKKKSIESLFSCKFSEWDEAADIRIRSIAKALLSFHSQKIADDLVDVEAKSTRTALLGSKTSFRKGKENQRTTSDVELRIEGNDEEVDKVGVNLSEDNLSVTSTSDSSEDDTLERIEGKEKYGCLPTSVSKSASQSTTMQSDESNPNFEDEEGNVNGKSDNDRVQPFGEKTSAEPVKLASNEADGEWETVSGSNRRGRRNSQRQAIASLSAGDCSASVSSETKRTPSFGDLSSRSSSRGSSPQPYGLTLAGHSQAFQDEDEESLTAPASISPALSMISSRRSSAALLNGLPPVAPVSSSINASGKPPTATQTTHRKRAESNDTLSISSVASSSTMLEECQTPSSWPSRFSSLTTDSATGGSRIRNLTPESTISVAVVTSNIHPQITPQLRQTTITEVSTAHIIDGIDPAIVISLDSDINEMASMLEQIAIRRHPWQLAVAERIKSMVEQMFPGATAQVFGSLSTGLAAPCSDVDMVVRNLSQSGRNAFRSLSERLRHESWVQMLQAVEHSAVPVIRLSTAQIPISFGNQGSLINVDITFDTFMHRGLRTSDLVKSLLQLYPPLKPLALVLKQFLVEKGLNDPFVGGLSSYGLVVMITAILQKKYPSGMSSQDRSSFSLGGLFVEFLREYATIEFIERGVWIFSPRMMTSDQRTTATAEYAKALAIAKAAKAPLYILDPLDIQNNIGRTCFGIHQVVQAFAEALEAIQLSAVRPDISSSNRDWSILGGVFATGHHRHVVHLVTQVWCPRENPVSKKPVMTMQEWAETAKGVLETMESRGRVCPWCSQKPHAVACTMKLLLQTFPSL